MRLSFLVKGGDFRVPAGFDKEYREIVGAASGNDGMVKITVEPNFKQRGSKVNAYFHVLCGRLSEMSGASKEQIKEMAKTRAIALGYPILLDEDGVAVTNVYGFAGIPSSQSTDAQCALLAESVHMLAAEYGYYLED
jgi:hypothetical protein